MTPYQRIIREGVEIQRGRIDTHRKFADVTSGVDLRGKRVLDLGCNLGEMCRLAKDAGASHVRGFDKEPGYVHEARDLNPDIPFDVVRAERATGQWDIVLAVGMLHYIADHKALFAQLARITKMVVGDVWLQTPFTLAANYKLSDRGLLVPSFDMFLRLASASFRHVRVLHQTPAPDHSDRFVFQLLEPTPVAHVARLIFGKGGTGKTTEARELAAGKGYEHLQLDAVFVDYRVSHPGTLSVSDFVDALQTGRNYREGEEKGGAFETEYQTYLLFHRDRVFKWLGSRIGLDVVIEGYDMVYPEYRAMVASVCDELGWKTVILEER